MKMNISKCLQCIPKRYELVLVIEVSTMAITFVGFINHEAHKVFCSSTSSRGA